MFVPKISFVCESDVVDHKGWVALDLQCFDCLTVQHGSASLQFNHTVFNYKVISLCTILKCILYDYLSI
jgi:hypothetical protein